MRARGVTAQTPSNRVVVVGAGPTGLWLASELALAGVDVTVLETRTHPSPYSRALGVLPRTLEILALRGAVAPFLAAGRAVPAWHFGLLEESLRFDTLDTPFPFMLLLPQTTTEALIEERARGLGVVIVTGAEVTGVAQEEALARVTYDHDGMTHSIEGALVVGCDGARSAVRELSGIAFEGEASSSWGLLGDVALDAPPAPGTRIRKPYGALVVAPLPDGRFRLTGWDPEHQDRDEELDLPTLRDFVRRVAGTDFGMHDPVWLSRFGDANRLAATLRKGRVLLAGDAAHIHWPTGGVGMNAGIDDAMALGWRAAAFVRGSGGDAVLDDYAAERRVYGEGLRTSTLTQTALITASDPAALATRATFNRVMATPDGNRAIADWIAGLNADSVFSSDRHFWDDGAPSVPGADGKYLEGLLDSGRPVLLTGTTDLDDAVRQCPELPLDEVVVKHVDLPAADGATRARTVLIRPDGRVAWTDATDGPVAAGLRDALCTVGVAPALLTPQP